MFCSVSSLFQRSVLKQNKKVACGGLETNVYACPSPPKRPAVQPVIHDFRHKEEREAAHSHCPFRAFEVCYTQTHTKDDAAHTHARTVTIDPIKPPLCFSIHFWNPSLYLLLSSLCCCECLSVFMLIESECRKVQ